MKIDPLRQSEDRVRSRGQHRAGQSEARSVRASPIARAGAGSRAALRVRESGMTTSSLVAVARDGGFRRRIGRRPRSSWLANIRRRSVKEQERHSNLSVLDHVIARRSARGRKRRPARHRSSRRAPSRLPPASLTIRPMHGGGTIDITPEILLKAYAAGIFPMAEDADDPRLFWVEPRERGILPARRLPCRRRLARTVRSDRFEVRVDHDFDARHRRLRGARLRPREDLDQRPHPPPLRRAVRPRPLPHGRGLSRRRARRRALRRPPRRRLLRREHVPPRARRLEGRSRASRRAGSGGRLHRSSTPSS